MQGKQRADSLFRDFSQRKVSKTQTYSGVLGITTGGKAVVKVTGRNNFVWVRLRNATNEVIQAFNDAVSNTYDLPVLVQYDPANPVRYRIVGRDVGRYSDWGWRGTQLPPHGGSHSFTFDNSGGGDMVWVYSRQIMPYLISPSGSVGQLGAVMYPHYYYDVDTFRWFGATGTPNLTPYKPTDDQARMVLLVLDTDSGNVYVATGTSSDFVATITGNALVAQYIPPLPDNNDIPLAAVRLLSGTSTIQWANIYDVRPFFYPPSAAGGAPSNAQYVVMALDGSLTNERVLVSGSDIKITDGGANSNVVVSVATGVFSRTDHTHPGGSSENVLPIYDNSIFKATGTAISFDNNLDVAVTGTIVFVNSNVGAGGGVNELPIYDDSVFKATGTLISFDDDLSVFVTGTSTYVNVSTGTFSRAGHTHLSSDAHDVSVYDDSVFKVTGTILDFTTDLGVSVTGTVGYIGIPTGTFSRPGDHTHPSSDNHDVTIYDDHIFKVTGTIIDFTDDLSASVTGTVAYVSIPTGTFSRPTHVHPSSDAHDIAIYDNEVFKITGTILDFTNDLDVIVTGTVGYIGIPTGTFSRPGDHAHTFDRTLLLYDDSSFKVTGTAISFDNDILLVVTGSVGYASIPTGTFSRPGDHTHLSSDNHDVAIYDDHVFKVTGTILDFVEDLDVSVTGTIAYIYTSTGTFSRANHTHPSSDSHDVAVYDDGVFKVTGTIIDFSEDLNVSVTGSTAYAYVSTGTFSRANHTHVSSDAHDVSIYDDHVFKVTGTSIDFVDDLSVATTGTFAYVSIPTGTFSRPSHIHPSSDNHDVAIYDNGAFKATGTIIDFGENLTVYVTGTAVFVDAASGGGTITGSGTVNRIAKFTSTTAIGDSNILDDGGSITITGTNVNIVNTGNFSALPLGNVSLTPGVDVTLAPSSDIFMYPSGSIDISRAYEGVNIHPIGNTYISPSGSVYFQGNGSIEIANAGNASIHPAGTLSIYPNGYVDITTSLADVNVHPTGSVNIYPSADVNIYPNQHIRLTPIGSVDIAPSGTAVYIHAPTGFVEIYPQSDVLIHPIAGWTNMYGDGRVEIYPNNIVNIYPSGTVYIHPYGALELYPRQNINIHPTDGNVDIYPSGSVYIYPTQSVDIHPLGEVTVDAANSITLQQDTYIEENLYVSGSVFTDGFTDYSSTSQIVGWASFTTQQIYYMKIGKMVIVEVALAGISNDTRTNFTVPYAPLTVPCNPVVKVVDGGTTNFGHINLPAGSVTGTCFPSSTTTIASWIATGTKTVRGTLMYITD